MKVTKVILTNVSPKPLGVCADAEIVIDSELCIKRLHVIMGKKGLFVAFPNTGDTRLKNNKRCYEDLVHPISSSLRDDISKSILEVYNSVTA